MSERPLRLVRAKGARSGSCELEVFDTRDDRLYRYFGSGTVWRRAEDGRRPGSSVERELCDLWALARYLESRGELLPNGTPSLEATGLPIRPPLPNPSGAGEALSKLVRRLRDLEPALTGGGGVYRGPDAGNALSEALREAEEAIHAGKLRAAKEAAERKLPEPPPLREDPRYGGDLARAVFYAVFALSAFGSLLFFGAFFAGC